MKYDAEKLIINEPRLVPSGQKLTAWGITLFFWAALLYLWQPLLSLIAWGLNINLFYNHMILLGGYKTFVHLLLFYVLVISVLSGGLILWARINQWRFRGRERRHGIDATDLLGMCIDFGVASDSRALAVASPVVMVHFATDGKIAALVPAESVSVPLTVG